VDVTVLKDSESTTNASIVISSTARGRFTSYDAPNAPANRDNDRNAFKFYSSNFADGLIGPFSTRVYRRKIFFHRFVIGLVKIDRQ